MTHDWKQRYFDTLAEAEQYEHELKRMSVLLRLTASRLAAPASGLDPQLDQQLDQLLAGVRSSPVAATVETLLDEISGSVAALDRESVSRDGPLQPRVTQGQDQAQDPAGPEGRFLDLLAAVPGQLLDDEALQAVRSTLQQQVPVNRWPETISQIAELICAAAEHQSQQVRELKGFLHRLTSRLKDIDRSLAGTQDQFAQNFQRGEEMAQFVNSDLGQLTSDMAQATDLPGLRALVELRTDAIHNRLKGFIDLERERLVAQDEELAALRSRVKELESSAGELKSELADARQAATHDVLTGVLNRRAFDERIEALLAASRRDATPLSLIMCDIDHFKKLNDSFGHQAGDKVLSSVAQVVEGSVRRTDLVARYGGEEFVVVLPGSAAVDGQRAAELIRAGVEGADFRHQGRRVAVTISCGCAELEPHDDAQSLFERADRLLYEAKANGRNRVSAEAPGSPSRSPLSRAG